VKQAAHLVVALALAAIAGSTLAADGDNADAQRPSPRLDGRPTTATVVVFNRPIVRFRAPVLGIPVGERARNASLRISRLLAAPGEHKVTTEQTPQGALVKIDGHIALAVTNDDAERLGEVAETAMATDAARAIEQVIAEMAEARNPRALLIAAGWSALATVVWLAILWTLRGIARALARRALRYAERKSVEMHATGSDIVPRERLLQVVRYGVRGLFWVLAGLATYEWLGFVLSRFPYTRPWGEGFASFLVDTLTGMLSAIADSVPGLIVALLIFLFANFAIGLLKNFFDNVQSGHLRFSWIDPDSARPTRRLVIIAVWLFAVAMAYPYIPGAETDAFKGLSVLLGLMVSVGASGIVGQAASGLILMYTRTFRPGEYVRINDNEGTIVALGLFTTRIRTGMGDELTVPNSVVLGTVTRNYSRAVHGAGFILDTTVTIGYDAPWRQVQAMLISAAERTDGVLRQPEPRVFQTALSDFYVEYRLVCQATFTEPRPRAEVLSVLHGNIVDIFNEHGVQIMSPHYFADPAEAKVVARANWYAPPARPPS